MNNNRKINAILQRALDRFYKHGWWGHKLVSGLQMLRYYNGSGDNPNCMCVGLHIVEAARELGLSYLYEDACAAFLSVVNEPKASSLGMNWFRRVTRWNDVPNRHPATVKRALKRAIAKTAA